MTVVRAERCSAELDGDFVVFLIGARINRVWKVHKWFPVFTAMPRMLAELQRTPELGLLHARIHFGFPNVMVVQYWRSFEHLHRYASDRTFAHLGVVVQKKNVLPPAVGQNAVAVAQEV